MIFDDKTNVKKERIPRVFYGEERHIKKYRELDAKLVSLFHFKFKKKYLNDNFLESIIMQMQNKDRVLVITEEHIIVFKKKLNKVQVSGDI